MKKIEIFEWLLVFFGGLFYYIWAKAQNFDTVIIIFGCVFSGLAFMVTVKFLINLFKN